MEYKMIDLYKINLDKKESKEKPLSLLEEEAFDGGTGIKYWM